MKKISDYNLITENKEYLEKMEMVLKLSKLFSSGNAAPNLNYRAAENLYCQFIAGTTDLSRSDIAIDAKTLFEADNQKRIAGIGIKTFLHGNGKTYQKIAEFNKDKQMYDSLAPLEKIEKIKELRNKRLDFCVDTHDLTELYYHCITRSPGGLIRIYNTPMYYIGKIIKSTIKISEASIAFKDQQGEEYTFNLSKSTLYKRFNYEEVTPVSQFNVEIADNPLEDLKDCFTKVKTADYSQDEESIVLPLYSFSSTRGKYVPEKSALNIWNAAGRERDPNEAYIGVSKKIHDFLNEKYKDNSIKFFPDRDTPFTLILPNGERKEAKLCQSNSKALMTNPNKELGEWLLRKVLNLPEHTLLTYNHLLKVGVDSVKVTRLGEEEGKYIYGIDFCEVGTYDEFALQNEIL